MAVKPSYGNFHPPNDIEKTPVILFCAGTGLAPFRGFIQERAIQARGGRKLAAAYLFIGCVHPDNDALFNEELKQWEKDGFVKLYYAYSKAKDQSKGCRYVQERLWEEREEMTNVFKEGAKVYVCGSTMVDEGVTATMKRIYQDLTRAAGHPKTDEECHAWLEGIKSDRYTSDVFA